MRLMRKYDPQTITPSLMRLRDGKRLRPSIFSMTAGQAEYICQVLSIIRRDLQPFRHGVQVVAIALYRLSIALTAIFHLVLVEDLFLRAQKILQSRLRSIETNEAV